MAKKTAMQKFAQKRLHAFKAGQMHPGKSGGGKQKRHVTSKAQAIAIMLSEARKKGIYHGPAPRRRG